MRCAIVCPALLSLALAGMAAEKPRVFVTGSAPLEISGDAAFSLAGVTSPQNIEVMKAFMQRYPAVIVTANRAIADFVVRLDHAAAAPTTLFVHGNKVAVFDRDSDLIYSGSTRLLASAVKNACGAIGAA